MGRGDALNAVGLAKSTYYNWRKATRRGDAGRSSPRAPAPPRPAAVPDGPVDQAVVKLRYLFMGNASLQGHARPGCPAVRLHPRAHHRQGRRQGPPPPSASAAPSPGDATPSTAPGRGAGTAAPGPRPPASWSRWNMIHSRDGRILKQSRAVCPISKFMAVRVFSRATARRFLAAMVEAIPFPLPPSGPATTNRSLSLGSRLKLAEYEFLPHTAPGHTRRWIAAPRTSTLSGSSLLKMSGKPTFRRGCEPLQACPNGRSRKRQSARLDGQCG